MKALFGFLALHNHVAVFFLRNLFCAIHRHVQILRLFASSYHTLRFQVNRFAFLHFAEFRRSCLAEIHQTDIVAYLFAQS